LAKANNMRRGDGLRRNWHFEKSVKAGNSKNTDWNSKKNQAAEERERSNIIWRFRGGLPKP